MASPSEDATTAASVTAANGTGSPFMLNPDQKRAVERASEGVVPAGSIASRSLSDKTGRRYWRQYRERRLPEFHRLARSFRASAVWRLHGTAASQLMRARWRWRVSARVRAANEKLPVVKAGGGGRRALRVSRSNSDGLRPWVWVRALWSNATWDERPRSGQPKHRRAWAGPMCCAGLGAEAVRTDRSR